MHEPDHPKLPGFPLLPVAVVGSFPLSPPPEDIMKSYYAKEDPYFPAIKTCIREQVNAGVQVISDGQTRANMVNIFASKLAGVRMKGKPQVFSEVRFVSPITVADQEFAQDAIDSLHQQYNAEVGVGGWEIALGPNTINNIASPSPKPLLKGIITGPYTMSQSVTDTHYHDEKELAFAFARALNHEARALQDIVPIIQIDEPFFSVNFIDYAVELITQMVDGITVPIVLHACGDVGAIFSDLIEMPVNVLDHEFTANPTMIDRVKEYDFPQMLGFGVVRSDHNRVESVSEIMKRLKEAVDVFGVEKLMVDPDCGMKHLSRDVAFEKLRNMRTARDEVLAGFSFYL